MKKSKITNIIAKDFHINWKLYLMVIPVIAFYILFCYKPMYGALIAFKNYSPRLGFVKSQWVGFKNFENFFTSPDFGRLLRNTLKISITSLIVGFPIPIILALFLNEVKISALKKFIQTTTYLPHFISIVVVCGMVKSFVAPNGIIGFIARGFGADGTNLLMNPKNFLPIYVISGIWQTIGWDSIIYLAALSAIDAEQYEAAEVDGAGRFRKMFSITLPSIQPTIITLLILAVGKVMNVGYEKVMLLYNPAIYETSDVISTYVYRLGFETQNWGLSTAVGLFNSVCNLVLILITNSISKKYKSVSLW
ncbi:MAG: sugar ABC transporter permease [Clostridia bacterium]|nr:sugar ABC transporter permease [Clostridia bacterium]